MGVYLFVSFSSLTGKDPATKSFCKKHKVSSFPTVKAFHKGEEHLYAGKTTVWHMETYVNELINPPPKKVAAQLGAFDEEDDDDDADDEPKKINKDEL